MIGKTSISNESQGPLHNQGGRLVARAIALASSTNMALFSCLDGVVIL